VSPNPVTATAAWTAAIIVDIVATGIVAVLVGWDRWCPAGVAACPTPADRADRDALWLAILGGVLVLVALVGLVTGRFLLVLVQLALVVLLATVVAQALPAAWTRLRERQLGRTAAAIVATTCAGPHSRTNSVLRVCETVPTFAPLGL
jgi:hypothetical protein